MINLSIRKISTDDFNLLYADMKSRLAAYYVNTLFCEGILSAFLVSESGSELVSEPAGYIIYDVENTGCAVIKYIYVHERHRRQGIARQLLTAAERLHTNTKCACVKICVSEKLSGFEYISSFLTRLNYAVKEKVYLFRCDTTGLNNWEYYMEERGQRLVEWIKLQGYRTVSFDCMSDDIMNALRETPYNSYNNNLDIAPFLDRKKGRLIDSMCYLAFKEDNIPAAYCIVTSPDKKSVVFEQISVAENHRNTGVILLPFAGAMKRCRELGYERAVYAMHESNATALAFANRFLAKITAHKNIQYNFIKNLNVRNVRNI